MSADLVGPAGGADRRTFLKQSAAGVAAGAFTSSLLVPPAVHAAESNVIRIGLVGCGGRGTGAAKNALAAGKDIKLVALGDAFQDRVDSSCENIKNLFPEQCDLPKERLFVGFDAYQKVIDAGVDVVLLCTPPHFRPQQLAAAVAVGKHVFCEKPVAVDGPGVKSVLATAEEAKKKNLSLVSGLCWRYDARVREAIQRVLDGAIGDIVTIQENYLTGALWMHPRQPGWSDMEWQIRNWLYFTWLSGDHNVEQHIHSLDKGMWAMKDEPLASAYGVGGRQVRTEPEFGHIFDHHAVVYEWANGVKMFSFCRQQKNCDSDVTDYIYGTKGKCVISGGSGIAEITGANPWKSDRAAKSMYQVEHDELFASIRSGKPINNGRYMALSTMTAILGRMVSYTGKRLTWEQGLNSQERLGPEKYDWGKIDLPPVPKPGITSFA